MDLCPKFWLYNLHSRNQNSSDQMFFSNLVLSSFGAHCSFSFLLLADREEPGVDFCCCDPFNSRSDASHVQRWSSAWHSSNVWLFHLPLRFCQLKQSAHSPLTPLINKPLSPTKLQHCMFFFVFHTITLEMLVCENPRRSAVSQIFKPPRLAPTVQSFCGLHSDVWFE